MTIRAQYYELHITMEGDAKRIQHFVEMMHWKFSAIDKDPVLGEGVKCYATIHLHRDTNYDSILAQLNHTANGLIDYGCEVIRKKIEFVQYDELVQ